MEFYGKSFIMYIDDLIDQNLIEPLLILLDHDYDEPKLGIKIYFNKSNIDKENFDYKVKLVGRMMGIQIFLSFFSNRLKQLSMFYNKKLLITYKETKYIYNPKKNNKTYI